MGIRFRVSLGFWQKIHRLGGMSDASVGRDGRQQGMGLGAGTAHRGAGRACKMG